MPPLHHHQSSVGSARVLPANGNEPKSGKQQTLHLTIGKSPPLLPIGCPPADAVSVASSQALPLPRKREGKLLPRSPNTALSSVGHPMSNPRSATPPKPVTLQSLCNPVELSLQPRDTNADQVASPPTNEPQLTKREKLKMRKAVYRAKLRRAKRQAAKKKE